MMSSRLKACGYCGVDLTCELLTTQVDEGDHMRYTAYGVRILNHDGDPVISCSDISTDRKFVEDFIEICYTSKTSAIHIMDVLDDYLK